MSIEGNKKAKELAIENFGTDDPNIIAVDLARLESSGKMMINLSIFAGVVSLPFTLIFIGIPILLMAVWMYFRGAKYLKKAKIARDYLEISGINMPKFKFF